MSKTYFKILDVGEYGWYAYAKDDIFILGDNYPHEGGTLYEGKFNENKIPYLNEFKRDCPKAYDDAVKYFNSRPKNDKQVLTEYEKYNFMMESYKTNKEIIEQAQAEIVARGNNPYYPMEQHLRDMALVAELTELKLKYE